MPIRRPSLTNADSKSELARKLVELVDEVNAMLVRLADNDVDVESLDTRLDAAETDVSSLESTRVEGRGSGASGRLATWSSANALTSDADATFDGTDLTITNRINTSNPGTTLQTALGVRVNVAGTPTTPRVMMGPTQNVGYRYIFDTFRGSNGAGACAAANLLAGDVVKHVLGIQPLHFVGEGGPGQFETTITVNGQIQQSSATDFSTTDWLAVVERRSATGATTERQLYVVP